MQRRVAAIYVAFFLVLGASAYSVIAVAQAPHVDIEGEELSQGDSLTVGGVEYTVAEITTSSGGGGGHGGGGGGATTTGTLRWVNESAQFSATLANNSTVPYENGTYRVRIANESGVEAFTLREQQNVTAILADDPDVYDETVTVEGTRSVVYRANNSTVPLARYLPEPRAETFEEGDDLTYEGNETTVANVTTERARLVWSGADPNTIDLSEGANVTLSGQQYVVHFPDNDTVLLSQDVGGYVDDQNRIDYFHERKNGLWGVTIISLLASVLVVGLAYLPHRG